MTLAVFTFGLQIYDRVRPLALGRLEQHRVLNAVVTAVSLPLTYVAVNYAWVYFRLATLDQAMLANRKIVDFLLHPTLPSSPPGIFAIFGAVLVMDLVTRFLGEIFPFQVDLTWRRAAVYGALTGILLVAGFVLVVGVPAQQFIYFNF